MSRRARPIGAKNSPNYFAVMFRYWLAWKYGRNLPHEGFAGTYFGVTTRPTLGFVIETRGHGMGKSPRYFFPFASNDRGSRKVAFARAKAIYDGDWILGDYSHKVPLTKRVGLLDDIDTHQASFVRDVCEQMEQGEAIWRAHLRRMQRRARGECGQMG